MLQQTRVAVVVERYRAFLARFPTLISLALAPEQEVLALWSGLGYYRRARMLHQAARFVAEHGGGNLPQRAEELRMLPGIGPYTAAAVASIAHGEAVAVVDGNVERVLCRVAGWEAGSRKGGGAELRRKIEEFARRLLDPAHAGDFNQAMMDLGATVCTPRSPQCLTCPFMTHCKTRGEQKTPRRAPMTSRDVAYALSVRTRPGRRRRHRTNSPEVLLEQRPARVTVMPGMWELPSLLDSNVSAGELRMTLRHSIMKVNYYVRIRTASEDDVESMTVKGGKRRWVPVRQAGNMPLTGLTRKVLKRAHLLPAVQVGAIVS
jgi:A/G-specific adenine glycosylase